MSSEMKIKTKNGNVPELRFPEFNNAPEWKSCGFYELLNEIIDFRGRTPLKLGMEWGGGNIISLSANNVKNGYIDYTAECNLGSQSLYEKWMGKVNIEKNDIVFTMEAPLGNALLIPDSEKYILSQRVVAFKTKKQVNNNFLIQLIWDSQFQYLIDRLSTGSTAKGINQSSLKKVYIKLPTKEEQKKIADCLSSLDNVILLQAKKIDALQQHKKGLMQKLFPAEGEMVPELRFGKLQSEWDIDIFSSVFEIIDGDRGKNYPKSDEFSNKGFCIFLNAKNVTKHGFRFEEKQFITEDKDRVLGKGKLQRLDVVLTTRGSIGQFAFFSEEIPFEHMRINSGMVILRIKCNKIIADYLYFFCKSDVMSQHIKKSAFGNAQQQLTVAQIKNFIINFPNVYEQRKIADCLSSLDELINDETQKLTTLKTHKTGLMQQLFPAMDEVNA
ncbi:restriction endonuclease subunit S [Brenneria populi]|uniref:Restriction endonuclease subunit S n=1 Tax=Brenneria populi TaxID=1505588 RepID=A0ABU6JUP5_9GAMM|nr:restriction endonuclease subunit S [Brenneria populi Li et al. 2015]